MLVARGGRRACAVRRGARAEGARGDGGGGGEGRTSEWGTNACATRGRRVADARVRAAFARARVRQCVLGNWETLRGACGALTKQPAAAARRCKRRAAPLVAVRARVLVVKYRSSSAAWRSIQQFTPNSAARNEAPLPLFVSPPPAYVSTPVSTRCFPAGAGMRAPPFCECE